VIIKIEGEQLIAEIDDDSLPPLRLNARYMGMLKDESLAKETKEFIKRKIVSAKWLMRTIHQRSDTLIRIAQTLAKLQKDFFMHQDGKLTPITMKQIAEELSLHESTIARAVANKYLNSPRGVFPLRSFFTSAYVSETGEDISSKTVRDALLEILKAEDKLHPIRMRLCQRPLKRRELNARGAQ